MRQRGRRERQALSGLWLVITLQLGCSLLPRERGLVLLEECREEPGVELSCRVAPRGFPDATFTLIVPYGSTALANTVSALKAANKARKRAGKSARLMKSLRAHSRFGAELAPLKPGDDPGRREAIKVWRKRIL